MSEKSSLWIGFVKFVRPVLRSDERPNDAERIDDLAKTVTPEHVCRRQTFFASHFHGLFVRVVDIGHSQNQSEARGGHVGRAVFRIRIAEHQRRAVYIEVYMLGPTRFVGRKNIRDFCRKRFLIKLACLNCTVHPQVGHYGSFYWSSLLRHADLPPCVERRVTSQDIAFAREFIRAN